MKKIFSQLVLFLVLALSITDLHAQDPRFSMPFRSAQNINPAFTGMFEGSLRAQVQSRNQWGSVIGSSSFLTHAASVDYRYNVSGSDYFSGGLQFLTDKGGDSGYTIQQLMASMAFMKKLSDHGYRGRGGNYLSAGIQAGFGRRSLSPDIWFSSQWNNGIDTSIPSGEGLLENSGFEFDLSAGLLWHYAMDEGTSFYAGASIFHLTNPNISLLEGGNESLDTRYSLMGGAEFVISNEFSVLPALVILSQGQSLDIFLKGEIRYSNQDWDEVAFRVGFGPRINNKLEGRHLESIVAIARLEMKRFELGLSFDINTSSLSAVSRNRGGFEFSLSYRMEESYNSRALLPRF